jgi:hypothetical protein
VNQSIITTYTIKSFSNSSLVGVTSGETWKSVSVFRSTDGLNMESSDMPIYSWHYFVCHLKCSVYQTNEFGYQKIIIGYISDWISLPAICC